MFQMSNNELMDIYLSEIGIIGFTTQILHAMNEIQAYTERQRNGRRVSGLK
jgi:hypothetical protein